MNFKELAQYPITLTCPVGAGFEMTVDANKYNGECFRRMARTYRGSADAFQSRREVAGADLDATADNLPAVVERYTAQLELSAITLDFTKEEYADVLASDRHGILLDWEVFADGQKVPPTYENLMQVPEAVLRTIFNAGRDAARPKEDGTSTQTRSNPTTVETSSDGSSDPTILSSASLIG